MLALILQKICNLLGEIKHIRLLVIIKWQMGNSGNKLWTHSERNELQIGRSSQESPPKEGRKELGWSLKAVWAEGRGRKAFWMGSWTSNGLALSGRKVLSRKWGDLPGWSRWVWWGEAADREEEGRDRGLGRFLKARMKGLPDWQWRNIACLCKEKG